MGTVTGREFRVVVEGDRLVLVKSRRPALRRVATLVLVGAVWLALAALATGELLPRLLPSSGLWIGVIALMAPLALAPLLEAPVTELVFGVKRTLRRNGRLVAIGRFEVPRDEVQPWLGARARRGWPVGARVRLVERDIDLPLVDVSDGDEACRVADLLARFLERPLARS
jgi:hypothetical protein